MSVVRSLLGDIAAFFSEVLAHPTEACDCTHFPAEACDCLAAAVRADVEAARRECDGERHVAALINAVASACEATLAARDDAARRECARRGRAIVSQALCSLSDLDDDADGIVCLSDDENGEDDDDEDEEEEETSEDRAFIDDSREGARDRRVVIAGRGASAAVSASDERALAALDDEVVAHYERMRKDTDATVFVEMARRVRRAYERSLGALGAANNAEQCRALIDVVRATSVAVEATGMVLDELVACNDDAFESARHDALRGIERILPQTGAARAQMSSSISLDVCRAFAERARRRCARAAAAFEAACVELEHRIATRKRRREDDDDDADADNENDDDESESSDDDDEDESESGDDTTSQSDDEVVVLTTNND